MCRHGNTRRKYKILYVFKKLPFPLNSTVASAWTPCRRQAPDSRRGNKIREHGNGTRKAASLGDGTAVGGLRGGGILCDASGCSGRPGYRGGRTGGARLGCSAARRRLF